jgi:hypothetical protein
MIKIILFPSLLTLISQIEEVEPEQIGEPDCKLVNPFQIKGEFLEPWLNEYTNQNLFMMHSDKFLTLADPNKKILQIYKELIN